MCPALTPSSERLRLVEIAHSWLGTPWHHEARIKGAGVDCLQLLIAVYVEAGLIDDIHPDPYASDWHLHRDEPRYLEGLLGYCDPVDDPLPGDIVMFKYGRQAAHGAIVIDWPTIIHAWRDQRAVVLSDVANTPTLSERVAGFYRLKGLS